MAEKFRRDILSGALSPGSRLPPQRELAEAEAVTLGTVFRAYTELRREGLVEARVGSGTFVTGRRGPADGRDIDLRANTPPLRRLSADVARSILRVQGDLDATLFAPQSVLGEPRHQAAAARWLAMYHRMETSRPALVASGGQSALASILLGLCRHGDTILTESLTFIGLRLATSSLGLRLVPVDLDGEGLEPGSFERLCRTVKPRLLFCTPNYHSPTASILPEERRRRVAAVAARYGVLVVEDDVYGAYLEDGPAPLASFHPGGTVLFTSFSKLVAPGLRAALVSAPPSLSDSIADAMRVMGSGVDPVIWHAMLDLMRDGALGDIIERNKDELRQRHALAGDVLDGLGAIGHPTCPHLWLPLPSSWTSSEFVRRLFSAGIQVLAADDFAVTGTSSQRAVRVSLSAAASLDILGQALRSLRRELSRPHTELAIA